MIDAIRSSEGFVPDLSLVAEVNGAVVGHVVLSYVALEGSRRRVLELGPLSVAPEHQHAAIGAGLVEEALRRADERGEPIVLVLGHPSYYPRLGGSASDRPRSSGSARPTGASRRRPSRPGHSAGTTRSCEAASPSRPPSEPRCPRPRKRGTWPVPQ